MSNTDPLRDLLDDYLDGQLDEDRLRQLEGRLRTDPEARRLFVRYARLHTDLQLDVQAQRAGQRALGQIEQLTPLPPPRTGFLRRSLVWRGLLAAAVLLALVTGGWYVAAGMRNNQAVAWLVNAQDCTWADGEPDGNLRAGKVLKIERGLAEVRFECGARVVLEGPATLELLSVRSARLLRGKLTARVPGPVAKFELLSPEGRVTDLGTEFGVQVNEAGSTDVFVFEGKVEARAGSAPKAVSLTQNQSARINAGTVTVRPTDTGDQFVRAIVPAPAIVPRTLRLGFDRPVADSLLDRNGLGTGLTHRLPGTGERLRPRDANLKLDADTARLELTTTNSDINRQFRLWEGEYLGVRLGDLGFTGTEEFAVTATFPDIPALEFVGQFGLYAGTRSDRNIRGGVLSARRGEPGQYTQFLVNNDGGRDADLHRVGLLTTGTDLRLTLKRTGGKYTLTVENLTVGGASTLAIRHPAFLDGNRDLHVGLFGANTQSEVRKTLAITDFQATVWTVTPR